MSGKAWSYETPSIPVCYTVWQRSYAGRGNRYASQQKGRRKPSGEAFYDRRLACPASGTAEAAGAGIALDKVNPNFSGSLPPYGATNCCVNASIQFYKPDLTPIGHNIRLSQHTWDGQLNFPHPGRPAGEETFIGDDVGNTTGATLTGLTDYTTSTSAFNDGSNPDNREQQVVATVAVP